MAEKEFKRIEVTDPAHADVLNEKIVEPAMELAQKVNKNAEDIAAVDQKVNAHLADDTLHLRADERDAWTSDRVKGSVRLTVSDTEPSNPNVNDIWIDISE